MYADLIKEEVQLNDGMDAIVVQKCLSDIQGGATLDCSDNSFADVDVIKAGHVIVKDATTGNLKPLAISSGAYANIGSDTAVGILKSTVLKSKPFASIVTIGQVNATVCPYTVTSAIKQALPRILFV